MIEVHLSEPPRHRSDPDERDIMDDDTEDDELEYFGITVKKRNTPSCPYNNMGEYVPRNKRR